MHDEDDNLLLMDIALSSLRHNSFFFFLTLIDILTMDILQIQLDFERIYELNFFITLAGSILLEKFGDLVFGVSKHHRPK